MSFNVVYSNMSLVSVSVGVSTDEDSAASAGIAVAEDSLLSILSLVKINTSSRTARYGALSVQSALMPHS